MNLRDLRHDAPRTPRERMLAALKAHDEEAFAELLSSGSPWTGSGSESKYDDPLTPLMWAALSNWPEAVEALVRSGSPVDEKAPDGTTALFQSMLWSSEIGSAAKLIALGACVEVELPNGDNLMHAAARRTLPEGAALLLASGLGGDALDKIDSKGQTPLCCMAEHGHSESATLLLAAGADPDKPCRMDHRFHGGLTPLFIAMRQDSQTVVQALLAAGADIGVEDPNGTSLLALAVQLGRDEITKILLEAGADPRRRSSNGGAAIDTPLLGLFVTEAPAMAREWADMLDLRDSLAATTPQAFPRPGRTTL